MNRLVQQAALPQAVTAAYDVANELTTFNNPTPNLTYDANGNLTNDGTKTYIWNPRNQLVAISGGGVSANFVYDAVGRRISKTINGARTDFQYDGNDIVSEIGGGSAVNATYIRSLKIDEPFARITSNGTEFYHTDALGSVFALTDVNGNTTASYSYDPFGNTTQTGVSSNPFQYTGRENDGTGLLYYRARYYSPALQRFISEDPFSSAIYQPTSCAGKYPVTLNPSLVWRDLYLYVENNPLRFNDPLGLDKSCRQNCQRQYNTCLQQASFAQYGCMVACFLTCSTIAPGPAKIGCGLCYPICTAIGFSIRVTCSANANMCLSKC